MNWYRFRRCPEDSAPEPGALRITLILADPGGGVLAKASRYAKQSHLLYEIVEPWLEPGSPAVVERGGMLEIRRPVWDLATLISTEGQVERFGNIMDRVIGPIPGDAEDQKEET